MVVARIFTSIFTILFVITMVLALLLSTFGRQILNANLYKQALAIVGNLEDWKTGIPGLDKGTLPMMGGSMFMGLTDTTITNEKPGGTMLFTGQDWSKARRAGDPRPAFYALGLVTKKIRQFTTVQRLDLGTGIWVYRFETPSGSLWVLWFDDRALYLPGEIPPSVSVSLPFEAASALLTLTPITIGQTKPETHTLQATGGTLIINLGATPVFIQVAP